MAITLAPDTASDAEITDGIGLGDLGSAARLWVRHWETALEAARRYVTAEEVPGLAAEALIATVSAIAIGRGPREDVRGFLVEAVRELGEDDEPPAAGPDYPVVFASAMMSASFAQLDPELQHVLRGAAATGELDDEGVRALTVLQHYYLAEHTDRAETPACRRAHIAMMSVADSSSTEGMPRKTWLHMSTCAWCTEAFHEVAFSNVALGALIEPAVLHAPPVVAAAPEPVEQPVEAFVEPVFVSPEEPLLHDAQPVPEEDDEDDEGGAAALVGAAHVGRRRGRLVAVAVAAAAAVSVVGVILVGQGDDDTTSPTSAGTGTSTSSAPTDDATTPFDLPTDEITATPTQSASVAGPQLTPDPSSVATRVTPGAATSAPSSKPSATASSQPKPSSRPTTAPPAPSSDPSPTATPSRRCNALQHLFGLC